MVLLLSLCVGTNKAFEHSERARSDLLYAILKGYKINIGTIIENSIMRYHEGNKRGLIPHPATITILCLKAGVKGVWDKEEEVPLTSPLLLTGVSKGPRNQKKKGVLMKTREEAPAARQEEENSENPAATNEGKLSSLQTMKGRMKEAPGICPSL